MSTPLLRERRLQERAAAALKRSAPSQRQFARELGAHETDVSHWVNDRPEYNPLFRDLKAIWEVARGRKTNPVPELVELHQVVLEAYLEGRGKEWAVLRWRELDALEHQLEGAQNHGRCSREDDRDAYRFKAKEHAAVLIELAALDEYLHTLGVDPLTWGRE